MKQHQPTRASRYFLTFEDGTTWPNPLDPTEVQWRLRYGNPTREDLLIAASFMNAYSHLLIGYPQSFTINAWRKIRKQLGIKTWRKIRKQLGIKT